MRITAVEPIVVEIPLLEPAHAVQGVLAAQRSALVRVTTDAGLQGWGDVDPVPGYSLMSADDVAATVRALTPRLLGLDAFNVRRVLGSMDDAVADRLEAKAAVEMALWDLIGQAVGLPIQALLGGAIHDEVRLNAWIGTVPPATAAKEAEAWVRRGFTTAKIKLLGASTEGVERVAAVRAAVGDRMALRVDFNESLNAAEAVPFIRRFEPFDLTLVEQPVPRAEIAALADIRRSIGIPLMADESVTDPASLVDIIRREAADIVKVKVMKQGGLLKTRSMIDVAAAAGLRVVVGHGFGLALSTIAEAIVAATSDAVLPGCEAVGPLKISADVVRKPLDLGAGVLRLPDAPGLGVSVDEDAVERYRVREA